MSQVRYYRRELLALVLALVATMTFALMSTFAASVAFENPAPEGFGKYARLWNFLSYALPALLIGTLSTRRVACLAAAASLISELGLLAVEYPNFVPIGTYLPSPMALWATAAVIGLNAVIAASAAMVVRFVFRWIARSVARGKAAKFS